MRIIPYLIYLLLIAFYRTVLIDWLSFGEMEIFLTPLMVLLIALYKSPFEALWFGLVAGLVFDAPDPSRLGVQMIILSALGIFTSQFKNRFNLDSMKGRLLLIAGGLVIYSIPYVLIYTTSGTEEFFARIAGMALPSIIYTSIAAWIFFLIKSGHLSYSRIKSIF